MNIPSSYTLDPSILREYDIRGIVGDTLTEEAAFYVGRGFGTMLRRQGGSTLGMVYDGRESSPGLAHAMIDGLNACGVHVALFEVGPTPLAYYAMHEDDLDACVSITGSHNPPEYNGIKMVTKDNPVYGDQIQEIGRIVAAGDFESGKGEMVDRDIYEEYTTRLAADYDANGKAPLKVVWDAGNGAAGQVLKMLTDKLPGEHILLFDDVDGTFPNHHPDPSVEKNLADIRRVVAEQGCDLGVAFDGDGDRIGVIDREGTVIWGDQLTALYARDIATRVPNALTILDVKCSASICDLINEWGGKAMIWKTGHSLAKAKMKETGAPIAGELSGHIFFKEGFYGHDDALYCAIRLFNVIHKFGDLSELKKAFPTTYSTPEIRFDVPEEDKFPIIERVQKNMESAEGVDVLAIDGVRVTSPLGWFLIRASNTQNALSIRAESTSENGFIAMKKELAAQLEKAGAPVPEELLA